MGRLCGIHSYVRGSEHVQILIRAINFFFALYYKKIEEIT